MQRWSLKLITILLCVLSLYTLSQLPTTSSKKLTTAEIESLPSQEAAAIIDHDSTTTTIKIATPTSIVPSTTDSLIPKTTSATPSSASSNQVTSNYTRPTPIESETLVNTTPMHPRTSHSAEITDKPLKWGAFSGSNQKAIEELDAYAKNNPDYLAYFIHWGNGEGKLPTFLSQVAAEKDRTLIIFWEASDYTVGGTDQPHYSYSSILDGAWDSYFESFATQLHQYKGPIILVPFSELNGNWTPWSGTKNGNTPEQAVLAYRYVHGFFDEVPNVSFGLAVNAASVPNTPNNQINQYYPGDEYVDYVGVDGFNMGEPWLSFDAIFSSALTTLETYNKPTLIFSFASAQGTQKASWLDDALNVQLPKYPFVKGWVYFNQNKERNWLLWSDEATLNVFTKYISR